MISQEPGQGALYKRHVAKAIERNLSDGRLSPWDFRLTSYERTLGIFSHVRSTLDREALKVQGREETSDDAVGSGIYWMQAFNKELAEQIFRGALEGKIE